MPKPVPTPKGVTVPNAAADQDTPTDLTQAADTEVPVERAAPVDPLTRRDNLMKAAIEQKKQFDAASTDAITHPGLVTAATETADSSPPDEPTKTVDTPIASATELSNDPPKAPSAPSEPESPIFQRDGVPMMKLKVSGQIVELPVAQVQSIAQKNILADNRLRESTRVLQEAKEKERQVSEREALVQARLTQLPVSGAEVDKTKAEASAKNLVAALFRGTEEQAIASITEFQMAHGGNGGIDMQALLKTAADTARLEARTALQSEKQADKQAKIDADLDRGMENITQDYPEIASDNVLFSMVDRLTEDLHREHPDWLPSRVMAKAAETVALKVGLKKASERTTVPADPTSPTGSLPSDTANLRQVKKVRLPQMPQALSSARTQPKPVVKVDNSPVAVARRMQEHRSALKGQTPRLS